MSPGVSLDFDLPELANPTSLIRIPSELDVPVTQRVLRLLDTPAMQRLKRISQLGLVAQVYPGAQHSRFEHSLGVYALARQVFQRLMSAHPALANELDSRDVRTFLIAALVHDVGHWPYCHPIEDLRLGWVPKHEQLARQLICSDELSEIIEVQWDVDPAAVADFLAGSTGRETCCHSNILRNILNGPVDIDKMDYLQRDSLHAGVPYGRNFDISRLIGSFCLSADAGSLAITEKGKTAAEMMVFARYVMFSEVYWHHTVRSATAMLQRLVYDLVKHCNPQVWLEQSDAEFAASLLQLARSDEDLNRLAQWLFGRQRTLYKRLVEYSYSNYPEMHTALARRPYAELWTISQRLSQRLSDGLSKSLRPTDVIIDAPPQKLEVQFRLPVRIGPHGDQHFVSLDEVSPVVKALATEQFDNYVKRVRVFVAPDRIQEVRDTKLDVGRELLRVTEG